MRGILLWLIGIPIPIIIFVVAVRRAALARAAHGRLTPKNSLPDAAIRALASANGSITTAMCSALA
jgi:hypothetical protein